MLLTEYETTLVVRPDIGGDAIETTLNRVREAVSSRGGKLLAINHWGKKKLAFPIAKHNRGIYVHTQYLGDGGLVTELERNLRIADNVLRYLTVRVADRIDPATRETTEYVAPEYEAEEVEEAAPAPTEAAQASAEAPAKAESAEPAEAATSEAPAEAASEAPAEAASEAPAEAATSEAPAEAPTSEAPAGESAADAKAATSDTNETKAE